MKKNKRSHRFRLLSSLTGLVVVALFLFWLNPGHIFHSKLITHIDTVVKSTSMSPTSISTVGTGAKKPSSDNGVTQETSTNNDSVSTPVTTSQNQWSVSQSGDITVKEPVGSSTIQSGAVLEGSATVDQVQYTLIDNQVGVISQGTINVANGNYSADINFQPTANSGRLDVYSSNPNGSETNLVEIPVNF